MPRNRLVSYFSDRPRTGIGRTGIENDAPVPAADYAAEVSGCALLSAATVGVLLARHGTPEEVALNLDASFLADAIEMGLGLDAFGDRGHAEPLAEIGDCTHNRGAVRPLHGVFHERAVDLDRT